MSQADNKSTSRIKAKLWGVRGSLPAPLTPEALQNQMKKVLSDYQSWCALDSSLGNSRNIDLFLNSLPRHRSLGYGGNTPCFEVFSDQQRIIVDGGSGIRLLGYELMKGPCGKGQGRVDLLFTHFHWDHLMGLPFFAPLFIPGNQIHLYSVQPELQVVFQTLFRKPFFPVELGNLGAQLFYHQLEPRRPVEFGDLRVTPYELDHPDPCWGYKFEKGGRALAYCVDTECKRVSRDDLGLDLPLYQGVDTMIFDAQYTIMESLEKVNWGHATASLGLEIAMREGIRRVVFVHHDPASSSEKIAAAENQAREYYTQQLKRAETERGAPLSSVEWLFGYEGMTLEV